MRACNRNLTDSKKNNFCPDYSRASLRYDRAKKCPPILYVVNLWLKPVSVTVLVCNKETLCAIQGL